jgi:hypothetical protein
VRSSAVVGGDALAVVYCGFIRGRFGFVVEWSTLAALSFGVGEDLGVGVGGFDGGAGLIDGSDLSMGGMGLTGPTDLALLDGLAGLERGLSG